MRMTETEYFIYCKKNKIPYIERTKELASEKQNKYNNNKTIVDGIKFDSQAEANYYCQLKILKRANKIKDFKLQPKYLLQESYKIDNKTIRAIHYIADFEIEHNDNNIEIVDVKGHKTEVYKLKKKLFEYKYKTKITEVRLDEI